MKNISMTSPGLLYFMVKTVVLHGLVYVRLGMIPGKREWLRFCSGLAEAQ